MNSDDIGELLDDLHKQVERCKVLFEQYFLGIQKTAPGQLHVDLERKIRQVTQVHIRNTGQRYRFTSLSQRFTSYNTYWKRTMRQIENGTYVRDMARVERRAQRSGKDIPDEQLAKMPKRMRDRILRGRKAVVERAERTAAREEAQKASGKVRDVRPGNVHQLDADDLLDDLDLDSIFSSMLGDEAPAATSSPTPAPARRASRSDSDTDVDDLFASMTSSSPNTGMDTVDVALPTPPPRERPAPRVARPASPRQTPAPPPRTAPSPKPPPGMSVSESQALYKRYKKARELVGENTSNLSYDKLMRSLNKQAPKILKDHKASGVSFNVVVKGDRVVLKAKPKK